LNQFSDWYEDEINAIFHLNINNKQINDNINSLDDIDIYINTSNSVIWDPILGSSNWIYSNDDEVKHEENNNYDTNLNWISTNNPVGESVIASVRNQFSCGSCWAFVAASAIEASVRINDGIRYPLSVRLVTLRLLLLLLILLILTLK
jgi:hypothetical protein